MYYYYYCYLPFLCELGTGVGLQRRGWERALRHPDHYIILAIRCQASLNVGSGDPEDGTQVDATCTMRLQTMVWSRLLKVVAWVRRATLAVSRSFERALAASITR